MGFLKGILSLFKGNDETTEEKIEKIEENNTPPEDAKATFKKREYGLTESENAITEISLGENARCGDVVSVPDGCILVLVKDKNIIQMLESGEYTIDEDNKEEFSSSILYFVSIKESKRISWGTDRPIPFKDVNVGDVSVNLKGTYTFRITDVIKVLDSSLNARFSIPIDSHIRGELINSLKEIVCNNKGISYTDLVNVINANHNYNYQGLVFNVNVEEVSLAENQGNEKSIWDI